MPEEETNKLLQLIDPKGKTILDVGCGDGRYSTIFSDTCKKYVGIDMREETIKANLANNTKKNVFYVAGNIVDYNPKEKFDVIVLSFALHEIDIREQGLAMIKILSLLKKNGQIIIIDPIIIDDSFQALWNTAYTNIKFYEHDYSVKHAQEVIQHMAESKICKIVKKDYLEIPFTFENIDEVCQMIIEDIDFRGVDWNTANREKLYDSMLKFLKQKENVTIYDKVDITILEKLDG